MNLSLVILRCASHDGRILIPSCSISFSLWPFFYAAFLRWCKSQSRMCKKIILCFGVFLLLLKKLCRLASMELFSQAKTLLFIDNRHNNDLQRRSIWSFWLPGSPACNASTTCSTFITCVLGLLEYPYNCKPMFFFISSFYLLKGDWPSERRFFFDSRGHTRQMSHSPNRVSVCNIDSAVLTSGAALETTNFTECFILLPFNFVTVNFSFDSQTCNPCISIINPHLKYWDN